jgi:hypothetical protein
VQLPIGADLYAWIDGVGNEAIDFGATSAMWDYRLTFGVERRAVPGRNYRRSLPRLIATTSAV